MVRYSHRIRLSFILHSVAQADERCPKSYSSSARMHRDCMSHIAGSKKGQDQDGDGQYDEITPSTNEAKTEFKGSFNDFR